MARGQYEFSWTPIPAILAYCYYRLVDKKGGVCVFTYDEFISRFRIAKPRSLENKVLNYRWLSGENRGLPKAARIAELVVNSFKNWSDDQILNLSKSVWQNKISNSEKIVIDEITQNWLKEMVPSRASSYLSKAVDHGIELSQNLLKQLKDDIYVGPNDLEDEDYLNQQYDELLSHLMMDIEESDADLIEKVSKQWARNPILAKIALRLADFKCEFDNSHETFESAVYGHPFLEAHHLIPISQQAAFQTNIDQIQNICVLCPNCHRKIHFGTESDRNLLLKKLYEQKKVGLGLKGLDVGLSKLKSYYS